MPAKLSANARQAAQDPKTIAYIGEFDPLSSAIPVPILNNAGILTVTPGDSAVGLTKADGGFKGEPEKYYPTGDRTFARVIPADDVQAEAIVAYMAGQGVKTIEIVADGMAYTQSLVRLVTEKARDRGLRVLGIQKADAATRTYAPLASTINASGAQAVFFALTSVSQAQRLWAAFGTLAPRLKLFAPNALATGAFARVAGRAAKNTFLTRATIDPKLYPPDATKVLDDFEAAYKRRPVTQALFGYEAMSAVLAAIKKAGDNGNDRKAVVDAFFAFSNRPSPLGTFSIDDDGDISLREYGGYRIVGGALSFDKVLEVGG